MMKLEAAQLEKLTQIIQRYEAERRSGKVVEYRSYDDLKAKWQPHLQNIGQQDEATLWATVEAYLADSVKTAHPQFFNALWSGQTGPGWIGEAVESLAHTSMYTYEFAPVATLLESTLLDQLKTITGFTEGEAQFTTGGSNSNLLALMLALHRRWPQVKAEGVQALPPVAVLASAEAHYSVDKAVNILGLGSHSLYKVATDDRGAMDLSDLDRQAAQIKVDGRALFCVVGTAGTTARGAFDDFPALAQVAQAAGAWFHIDGAWGASVLLSSTRKHLLEGLDQADSLAWNAHKMLGLPLMCAMLFTRVPDQFDPAFNLGDGSYLFYGNPHDTGPKSLQCGRRVNILKWWLEWQYYGPKGLGERVDRFMALAEHATARIAQEPKLELVSPPWINQVCFRVVSDEVSDLDTLNRRIRTCLHETGQSMVKTSVVAGKKVFSLILTNHSQTKADVDHFFDNVLMAAQQFRP